MFFAKKITFSNYCWWKPKVVRIKTQFQNKVDFAKLHQTLFFRVWGGGHWRVPNTAIPWEKLANTKILCWKSTKYRYRIYDRTRLLTRKVVIISHVSLLQACTCMHQQSASAIIRKCEKTSKLIGIIMYNYLKARSNISSWINCQKLCNHLPRNMKS